MSYLMASFGGYIRMVNAVIRSMISAALYGNVFDYCDEANVNNHGHTWKKPSAVFSTRTIPR